MIGYLHSFVCLFVSELVLTNKIFYFYRGLKIKHDLQENISVLHRENIWVEIFNIRTDTAANGPGLVTKFSLGNYFCCTLILFFCEQYKEINSIIVNSLCIFPLIINDKYNGVVTTVPTGWLSSQHINSAAVKKKRHEEARLQQKEGNFCFKCQNRV